MTHTVPKPKENLSVWRGPCSLDKLKFPAEARRLPHDGEGKKMLYERKLTKRSSFRSYGLVLDVGRDCKC